jgi:hypothetical protein
VVKPLRRWLEANELFAIVTGVVGARVVLSMLLMFAGYPIVTRGNRKRGRSISLSLPVADAARLAWPGLNPRIEGLRIERIAVSPRESGVRDRMPLLFRQERHVDSWMRHERRARGRGLDAAIGPCFDRDRREFG